MKKTKYRFFIYLFIFVMLLAFTFNTHLNFMNYFKLSRDSVFKTWLLKESLIVLILSMGLNLLSMLFSKIFSFFHSNFIKLFIYILIVFSFIFWTSTNILLLGIQYNLMVIDLIKNNFYLNQLFFSSIAAFIVIVTMIQTSIPFKKRKQNEIPKDSE